MGYLLMAFELIEPDALERFRAAGVFDVMGFTVVPMPAGLMLANGNGDGGGRHPVEEPAAAAAAEAEPATAAETAHTTASLAASAGVADDAAGPAAAAAAAVQGPMHELHLKLDALGQQLECLMEMKATMQDHKRQQEAMMEQFVIQLNFMKELVDTGKKQQQLIEPVTEMVERVDQVRHDYRFDVEETRKEIMTQHRTMLMLADKVELQRMSLQRILNLLAPPKPPMPAARGLRKPTLFLPCAKRFRH